MTSDYLKRLDVQGDLKVKEALRKWDPIGVYGPGSNWSDDEYNGYSFAVVDLIDRGASKEEILKYLEQVCVQHMELPFDRNRAETAIDEVLVFWPTWKKELEEKGPLHFIE